MSVPHAVAPLRAPDLVAALNGLRRRGLRVSAARRTVLEALFTADRPVTAEEIAGGLGGRLPAGDLGSVYRNLDALERAGLVSHVHAGHGPGLYARRTPGQAAVACCERCGACRPIDHDALAELRALACAATGLQAAFTHFPLLGLCHDCAEEPRHAHP